MTQQNKAASPVTLCGYLRRCNCHLNDPQDFHGLPHDLQIALTCPYWEATVMTRENGLGRAHAVTAGQAIADAVLSAAVPL